MPETTHPVPPKMKNWLDERRKGIGGSDAAVVLGLSPWKSPLKLYKEKRKEIPEDDIGGKEFVYWGTILEEPIAREYSRVTGFKIRRVPKILKSKTHPHMLCSLDREVIGVYSAKIIVEVKCVGLFQFIKSDWGADRSHIVAPYYYAQAQHNCFVAGADQCDMPVLIGGNEFRLYRIPRDEKWLSISVPAEQAFWDGVVNGTPPEPVSLDDLLLMWPEYIAGKDVEADLAEVAAWRALLKVKEKLKEVTGDKERFEMILKKKIGDADTLSFNGEIIATWRNNKAKADGTAGNRVFKLKELDDAPKTFESITEVHAALLESLRYKAMPVVSDVPRLPGPAYENIALENETSNAIGGE